MILSLAFLTSCPFWIHQVILGSIMGWAMYFVYFLNLGEKITNTLCSVPHILINFGRFICPTICLWGVDVLPLPFF